MRSSMGNCINRSSSSVATTVTQSHHTKPVAEADVLKNSSDERTAETSSNATISPPGSPVKPDVPAEEVKREDASVEAQQQQQHALTQPKLKDKAEHDASTVEQQREDGQRRLRELVISGANAGEIDWKAIISLAEDLHKKEQQLLRSYNDQRLGNKKTSSSTGCNSDNNIQCRHNISKRQAFFEKRRRRREISRRRKLESAGSFSVNLLMYEAEEEQCSSQQEERSSSILNENDNTIIIPSSGEKTMDDSEGLDIFEDDDPSPLHHDPLCSTSPCRERRGTAERPGTPAPFVRIGPASIAAEEGSFMAATSLFDSFVKDEDECSSDSSCSSSDSSTSSVSQRENENWDLMTIDEDATVTDW